MACKTSPLRLALMTTVAFAVQTGAVQAQSATAPQQTPAQTDVDTVDEIVVTGIRATQRNSIAVKRDASVIVDALVNEEIGALPDNSVGETLERITGVTADRFKGSASEISIRGLGPYLGFSTVNGREVSSGSGDRAVSFQQFPSELTNGVLVYKTQQADFVEGGVSGVIELRTLRPLDYGRRRFQAEARANYLPYADKAGQGLGSRLSASYVDQFETAIGDIGVAVGLATTDSFAPEDFYTASSSFRPCNTINARPTAVTGAGTANCSYSAASANPVYFVANQYGFRQLVTEDTRRALTGNLQWRPNDRWDLNLDVQLSQRTSFEDRHDLSIAEGRRGVQPTNRLDNGALLGWAANSYLESVASERIRDEDYAGGGLSARYQVNNSLAIEGDLSYSRTHREQLDFATRLRSNTLFGPSGRVPYTFDQSSSDIPVVTFVSPIDLNDHDAYTGSAYARRGLEDRVDEIAAARIDVTYDRQGLFEQWKFGTRFSEHQRVTDLGNDNDRETIATADTLAGNADCRIDNVVRDWGEDSGTNITSWAQFDTRCLYRAFTGSDDLGPLADPRSTGDLDISETIAAAYAMGSFRTEIGNIPVTGNVGVRFVRTDVTSRGFREDFNLVTTVDPVTGVPSFSLEPIPGILETVEIDHSYDNVLPSLNFNAELRENLFLRGGVYKAISRSNIEDLGAGRTLVTDANAATPEEALAGASGGNPRLDPLESTNFDLSLEYYPSPDTSFAFAVFSKTIQTSIVPAGSGSLTETFLVDGTSFTVPVAQQTNSDEESYLRGFEVAVNHAFTNLPTPFNGLGLQASYSHADSDFDYPDPSAVDPANPLANFTDPVGIPGLSKHVASLTGYYEDDRLSFRVVYKYRSAYFKPFALNANRVVEDAGYLDLSATCDLTDNVQAKVQAINVGNEHQVMYRPVGGSIAETSYFGPSYFAGIRVRF